MNILYENVTVTINEQHDDSVDYKVEINGKAPIFLRKCHAYTDFDINPVCPRTYSGKYEIWENGMSIEKNGFLHFYPKRVDILLEE